MKQLIQILSFLFITNVFYAQKQVNPVLKELNEIIVKYHKTKNFLGVCLGHLAIAEVLGYTLKGPIPDKSSISNASILPLSSTPILPEIL